MLGSYGGSRALSLLTDLVRSSSTDTRLRKEAVISLGRMNLDSDAAPAVFVDAAWLAARGAGPYVLDQAGATYVLQTDVRTPGTAFVAGAAAVVLDLNGYAVTYGDSAPLGLANGGFEQGRHDAQRSLGLHRCRTGRNGCLQARR